MSDELILDVDGRELRVTHPEKIYFSEAHKTKLDLINYYLAVAEPLLRTVQGRPVLLQRFRDGADGPGFFQKRIPDSAPSWLETTTVSTVNGTDSRALVIGDIAHVAWAAQQGCLGLHVWPYMADDPAHADELRLDLDPQPGTDFTMVRAAAKALKAFLDELGIVGYPKTTGNRGLHVYIRLEHKWDSYEVRQAAVGIAREMQRRHGDILTAEWWKEDRGERIFLDYNQNAPHKTVFGAWSVRARKGAQVSTPLTWDEVDTYHPDELTMDTVPKLVGERGDPWHGMNENPQSLEPMHALYRKDRENGLMDAPWPPVYPKQPDEPPRVSKSRAKKA